MKIVFIFSLFLIFACSDLKNSEFTSIECMPEEMPKFDPENQDEMIVQYEFTEVDFEKNNRTRITQILIK